jgi:hypothetical protein
MGFSPRFHWNQFRSGLQTRVQRVSEKYFSSFRIARKRLLSIFWIALAGLFGVWANEASELQAWNRFKKDHFPGRAVISAVLNGYHFVQIQESDRLQKILRTVPTHLDEEGAFWISTNRKWIVHFSDWDDWVQAQVFSLEEKGAKATRREALKWERLGVKWEGIERLLRLLEEAKQDKTQSKPFQSHRRFRDPREIVY